MLADLLLMSLHAPGDEDFNAKQCPGHTVHRSADHQAVGKTLDNLTR